jgi:hypothetical protein
LEAIASISCGTSSGFLGAISRFKRGPGCEIRISCLWHRSFEAEDTGPKDRESTHSGAWNEDKLISDDGRSIATSRRSDLLIIAMSHIQGEKLG